MLAIQFGAGNIGRGFIGALAQQSGYQLVFADVVQDMIDKLNDDGKYIVHVSDVESNDVLIDNVSAVNSTSDEIFDLIAKADLLTTAVGVGILSKIAPTIAKGISFRREANIEKPLNVIACENAVLATNTLKEAVYDSLSDEDKSFADKYIGFANCSVDRIVPPCAAEGGTLDVSVENYFEWNICEAELKSPLNIEGANLVSNLEAYVERKLFTLNTGHAITAYLGCIYEKNTIEEAINCEAISKIVKNAMIESGSGLCKKHGFSEADHNNYIVKIINRFKNPHLCDDVNRVGREPLRKLSISDRLVKPTLTALQYDLPVDNLLIGIAAALHFNNPEDNESVEMQEKIAKHGLRDAVADITGIQDKDLLEKIEENYYRLLDE